MLQTAGGPCVYQRIISELGACFAEQVAPPAWLRPRSTPVLGRRARPLDLPCIMLDRCPRRFDLPPSPRRIEDRLLLMEM